MKLLKLNSDVIIRPDTKAYIENGNWTHYFAQDSYTLKTIGFINKPSHYDIHAIPDNITYQQLHPDTDLDIVDYNTEEFLSSKDQPFFIKQQENYNEDHVRVLKKQHMYTNGIDIYKNTSEFDYSIIVLNPKDLKKIQINILNIATGQLELISVTDLYPQDSKQMANALYGYSTDITNTTKQIFLSTAIQYSRTINDLYQWGRLLDALASPFSEKLQALVNEQIPSNYLEIPGYFHYPKPKSDSHFIQKINQTDYLFQQFEFNDWNDTHKLLESKTVNIGQLRQMIQLVNDKYFGPNKYSPTIDRILEIIVISDLIKTPNKFNSKFQLFHGERTAHKYSLPCD